MKLKDLIVAIESLSKVHLWTCRKYTQALDAEGIPYSLIKGSAVKLVAYPSPFQRCGLDIDIGVPARFLKRAERVAYQLGFVSASLDETGRHFFPVDRELKAEVEANHYELACLVRKQTIEGFDESTENAIKNSIWFLKPWHTDEDGKIGCYSTLDVHHGLCLDIEVDSLVKNAVRWKGEGYSTNVPTKEWLIFHIIFKLYWEGVHNYRKGGYQYADLIRLSHHLHGRTALELVKLLSAYELEAAGYYVLRRLETEFAIPLSDEIKVYLRHAALAPEEFPNEINDLGDMWPKLWGFR